MSNISLKDQLKGMMTTGKLKIIKEPAANTGRPESRTRSGTDPKLRPGVKAATVRVRASDPEASTGWQHRKLEIKATKKAEDRRAQVGSPEDRGSKAVASTRMREGSIADRRPPAQARSEETAELAEITRLQKWTTRAQNYVKASRDQTHRIKTAVAINDPKFVQPLADVLATATKIHEKVQKEQAQWRNREMTRARRSVETVINYVLTVQEAAAVNDISLENVEEVHQTLNRHLREVHTALKAVAGAAVVRTDKAKQVLDEPNVQRYRQFQQQLDRAIHEATAKDQMAFTIDLPVIPILTGGATTDDLLAAYLPAEPIGMYSVLLRQRVIAIDPERLNKAGYDRDKYIRGMVKAINSRSTQNWILVTDNPIGHTKTHRWYWWIMPSKSLTALQRAGGKTVGIDQWGLAF